MYKKTHESSVFYHYNFNPNNPRSLAGNYVNKLYQDKSGVLWVATNSGLSKYSPIRKRFPHFYHIPGEKNTVSSNRITDAVEDNDGIIWLATANNGIDRFDRKNNQFTNYNTETKGKGKLSSNRVSSLYIDKDNILWIGLWSGVGFNKFNTKTKTVEHFVIDPNSRDTDWYNDFVRSNNDTLYIGVWGGPALYSFDIKNKKIIPCGNNLEVIPNNKSITKIYIEKGKGLWLASPQYGIDNYSLSKRKHSYYRHFDKELKYNFKLTQKLESNNIIPSNIPLFSKLFDIVADKEEILWLATDKGIICKKNNDNNFSLFTNNEGAIFNKSYSALTYDSTNNNIWTVNDKVLKAFLVCP